MEDICGIKLSGWKNGKFFQINKNDCSRLSSRAFQQADSNADKELDAREIKTILRNVYRGINSKRRHPKEEIDGMLKLLDPTGDGKVAIEDIDILTADYFVNNKKLGCDDFEINNPELFSYKKSNKGSVSLDVIEKKLMEEGNKRFGPKFMKWTLLMVEDIIKKNNLEGKKDYDYGEVFHLYKSFNKYDGKGEDYLFDDYERLVMSMSYDGTDRITKQEFEIFVLKSTLGG